MKFFGLGKDKNSKKESEGKLQATGEASSSKEQKASTSTASMEEQLKNLEKALASSQEEAAKASSRNEKERRDLAQKLQSVEDRLVKVQAENEKLKSDLARQKAVSTASQDAGKFESELKSRDDEILSLTAQLQRLNVEKESEMARVNEKIKLVIEGKDHQIKRLNALGPPVDVRDGGLRTAISAEASKKIARNGDLINLSRI